MRVRRLAARDDKRRLFIRHREQVNVERDALRSFAMDVRHRRKLPRCEKIARAELRKLARVKKFL